MALHCPTCGRDFPGEDDPTDEELAAMQRDLDRDSRPPTKADARRLIDALRRARMCAR